MNNLPERDEESNTSAPGDTESTTPFRYVFSQGFATLLEQQKISLLVTTYQAGKLMAVRARGRIYFQDANS